MVPRRGRAMPGGWWLALACAATRAADVVETCAWNAHEATCAGPRAYASQRAYYDNVAALDAHLRSVGAPPEEGHSAMCPRATVHLRAVARAAAANRSTPVKVCEVGFNAGHSALNWLSADPLVIVDAFDLGAHASATAAFAYLSNKYPGRLRLTLGDSRATLPLVDHAVACDVVFVDGGHDGDVPAADLGNLMRLAARGAPLLVDNANMAPVRAALSDATARGLVLETGTLRESCSPALAASSFSTDDPNPPVDPDQLGAVGHMHWWNELWIGAYATLPLKSPPGVADGD